jgi:hypothetical protein
LRDVANLKTGDQRPQATTSQVAFHLTSEKGHNSSKAQVFANVAFITRPGSRLENVCGGPLAAMGHERRLSTLLSHSDQQLAMTEMGQTLPSKLHGANDRFVGGKRKFADKLTGFR